VTFTPSYLALSEGEELKGRIASLREILKDCQLCPRQCKVNRLEGERGACGAGLSVRISSAFPHFGEEPPLVGRRGSGTIFLTHCNLLCVFCQNYDISHLGQGEDISCAELAQVMIRLQEVGCHNINFVTPTHFVPQIVASLPQAIEEGLRLPLVYNCGGYESLKVIKLLDGIVDIYMPDVKYARSDAAQRYSQAPDYPAVVKGILKEMHRQVGDLRINGEGIAERGLVIRHLVMPNGVADTESLMEFISQEISPHSYVNIMSQYRPEYRGRDLPEISRRISREEYSEALAAARSVGLYRGFDERG
jgi:putative pyruvate formate lyase activating enzyme